MSYQFKSEKINEEYYARDNQPNFNQLRGKNHFYDQEGREYTIASRNKQTFQNDHFSYSRGENNNQYKECMVDPYGRITLYVRLTRGSYSWFSGHAIGKELRLIRKSSPDYSHLVLLDSAFKYNPKRCTGTITVSGLDPSLCERLLNAKKTM